MASAGGTAADEQQAEAYERLGVFIKNNQHRKAAKTADEILAANSSDEDAHRVKIAALLQLSEWQLAMDAIKTSGLGGQMVFERAYCLYRLGRVEEGVKELEPLIAASSGTAPTALPGGPTATDARQQVVPALELAAQLQYRLGHSRECIQLYDTLFQQYKAGSLELRTNVLAAYVAAGLSREILDLMAAMKLSSKDSFEVGYNKACGLVEQGQWAAAETELRMALRLGRETLFEEECSEEEVAAELAPVTVQLGYVLSRLGRTAEAQELYDQVVKAVGEDAATAPTRAVAVNNMFADSGRIDASATHKKSVAGAAKKLEGLMEDAQQPGSVTLQPALEARLSSAQKRVLALNRALTYLLSGRLGPARDIAEALARQDQAAGGQPQVAGVPGPQWAGAQLLPLLQAALLVKDGKAVEADKLLDAFTASAPSHGLQPTLARAQLALEAGDATKGAQLLAQAATYPQASTSGAVLSTRVALHQQLGDAAGAEALLSDALALARQQSGQDASASGVMQSCLESLVTLRLRLGRFPAALKAFQELQDVAGGKSTASVSLAARLLRVAAASGDAISASQLSQDLPPLPSASLRSLDIDSLEAAGLGASKASGGTAASGRAAKRALEGATDVQGAASGDKEASQAPKRRKARNKHKKRLPKGWNPELADGGLPPPDPERWLPKWQRTDTKKKKLKSAAREKGAVKGSQGAGKVDDALDRTRTEAIKPDNAKATSGKPAPPSKPSKKGRK